MTIDRIEPDVPGAMKHYREKRGMTQGDIMRATGFERAYVSRLETGKAGHPTVRTMVMLARAMGVDPGEFLKKAIQMAEAKQHGDNPTR